MPQLHTIYIGIDPGKSGGVAILVGNKVGGTHPMPATERDVWELIRGTALFEKVAVIEKVGGYIQGNPAPGSAMFNFGMGYGGLRMALVAADIPFEGVTPQRWQKAMGIAPRKKTESKTQFKNRIKARAQQLYPTVKVTLAVADAIMIAAYCRKKVLGLL